MNDGKIDRRLQDANVVVQGIADSIRMHWKNADDARVSRACNDFHIIAEFADESSDGSIDDRILVALSESQSYLESFDQIRIRVTEFGGYLGTIATDGYSDYACTGLESTVGDALDQLRRAVDIYVQVVGDRNFAGSEGEEAGYQSARRVADRTLMRLRTQWARTTETKKRQLDAEEQGRRRDVVKSEAQLAKKRRKEATESDLPGSLGRFYFRYAEQQRKLAGRLRLAAAALLGIITAVAIYFVVKNVDLTVDELLIKLTITIPVAVLTGYLIKESSRHHANAKWARELAVVLNTLPSFTDGLDPAEQKQFRSVLGLRIFAAPDAATPDPPADESSLFADLERLLDKVLQILRRGRQSP